MFGLVVAVTPEAVSAPAYSSAMIWLSGKSAEPITSEVVPPDAVPLLAGALLSGSDDPPQAESTTATPSPAARPPNVRRPRPRSWLSFMIYLLVPQPPRGRGLCDRPWPAGRGGTASRVLGSGTASGKGTGRGRRRWPAQR